MPSNVISSTVQTNSKPWYTSKQLWFNVLTLVAGLLTIFTASPLFANKVQILEGLGLVSSVVNFALRFVSSAALTLN